VWLGFVRPLQDGFLDLVQARAQRLIDDRPEWNAQFCRERPRAFQNVIVDVNRRPHGGIISIDQNDDKTSFYPWMATASIFQKFFHFPLIFPCAMLYKRQSALPVVLELRENHHGRHSAKEV
jgi:hypothetical protein